MPTSTEHALKNLISTTEKHKYKRKKPTVSHNFVEIQHTTAKTSDTNSQQSKHIPFYHDDSHNNLKDIEQIQNSSLKAFEHYKHDFLDVSQSPQTHTQFSIDDRFKYSQPYINDEPQLFTPNIHAPKYTLNGNSFGFFKPHAVGSTKPKVSNFRRPVPSKKYPPIHSKFATDLAIGYLPLQSIPSHLKHFRSQSQAFGGEGSSVASSGQIDMYNYDAREKMEEQRLKNSKNPADRAKYHQYLKAKEDERIEQNTQFEFKPAYRPHGENKVYERPRSTHGLGKFRTHYHPKSEKSESFPFL